MGTTERYFSLAAAAMLAAILAACGGGGSSSVAGGPPGNGPGSSSLTSFLALVAQNPSDGELQVDPAGAIRLQFNGFVVPVCLEDEDTYLSVKGTTNHVPGSFILQNGGQTVLFQPASILAKETEYTFHLSSLTCSTDHRLLENAVHFDFRTLDDRPPTIRDASVHQNATSVSRTADLWLSFDEQIEPATLTTKVVTLKDSFGHDCALQLTPQATGVTIDPVTDLVGLRKYTLVVKGGPQGLTDRVGNPLATTWSVTFTTAQDLVPPLPASFWPGSSLSASPHIQPEAVFDESIDPASIGPGSILFIDGSANNVPYSIQTSLDQKTVRVVPLAALQDEVTYIVVFVPGSAGVTDVSGNHLQNQIAIPFEVGSDAKAPSLQSVFPKTAASRVSVNVQPLVSFDEALDPARVTTGTVVLRSASGPVPTVVTLEGSKVRVVPVSNLAANTGYTLVLSGSAAGLRDPAGNFLPQDIVASFKTAADNSIPTVRVAPMDGTISVPIDSRITVQFDQPLDPSTVTPQSFSVLDPSNVPVSGDVTLLRDNRVIRFVPRGILQGGYWYRLTIGGGASGVRTASGNWLLNDVQAKFKTSHATDAMAPTVTATINVTDPVRNQGLSLPPHGFEIDIDAVDRIDFALDMTTVTVSLQGPGQVPSAETIFADATIVRDHLSYRLPASLALLPGSYTLTASVEDLSGHRGTSTPLAFQIRTPDNGTLPFEHTQVVWVRTDLDRDRDGLPDFQNDMLNLGLMSQGDPAGTNARMVAVLRDGILAQANELLHRGSDGSALGADSVSLRLTDKEPRGIPRMQIALGGLDPDGGKGRSYGDESSGILGRALFDYRNRNLAEDNTSFSKALGVFPGELFLFEARIHIQVFPSFVTAFAAKFLNVSPPMGGTPAGSDPLDKIVLAAGFDFAKGTTQQRARYRAVFDAADDWATAIGTILAHEIGHSIGLTATGPNPKGLHGDQSLHNALAGATDVMAPAVSYTSLILLDYGFRDLNLAYLRQRLLMK